MTINVVDDSILVFPTENDFQQFRQSRSTSTYLVPRYWRRPNADRIGAEMEPRTNRSQSAIRKSPDGVTFFIASSLLSFFDLPNHVLLLIEGRGCLKPFIPLEV